MHQIKLFFVVILLINLFGCAALTASKDPRKNADDIAAEYNLVKSQVKTNKFKLTTYSKNFIPSLPLTIYIEGDGHSWINRYQVSPDPTPHNPLALKLAVLDPHPNVVYLARPCQYTPLELEKHCHSDYWTEARFSEIVISAMNEAVEKLKQKTKAKKIHLVGFSGGAAVAILIAARRNDIASIRTLAGDLDHVALSDYHQTTPLTYSLNPKDVAHKIAHIPQHHLIGDKDPIVPSFISQDFVNIVAKINPHYIKRTLLKNVTHHQGFEKVWLELLQIPVNYKN